MRFISGKSQKGFWSPCKSLSRVLCLTHSLNLFCWKEVRQERRQGPRRSKSGNAVSCLGPRQSPISTLYRLCPQVYINLLGTHPGFLWGFQINMISFKKRGKNKWNYLSPNRSFSRIHLLSAALCNGVTSGTFWFLPSAHPILGPWLYLFLLKYTHSPAEDCQVNKCWVWHPFLLEKSQAEIRGH